MIFQFFLIIGIICKCYKITYIAIIFIDYYWSYLADKINCTKYSNYEDLVKAIKANDLTNTTVLLSPAAASYDMFKNFEERGKTFEKLML